jgi:sugar O-acyltransferase (sialic acid O-acetyltransferase NeuD family)
VQSELKRLLIAGCGGFGVEVEGFLRTRGVVVQGYLDDVNPTCTNIDDYEYRDGDQIVVAIGDPRGREQVVERLKARKAVFHGMLFHIGPMTHRMGGGCVTMPYSVVSAFGDVADFCHVGLGSLVGHHVKLGEFCTLSSQVDLTGHVTVGRGTYFGSGARVLPRVQIGEYCTIGAGAVVMSNVPDGATIYAAPGRRL